MPTVHSHYENLKVARDAPPEVIRAAYRALARRYHPDVNASDEAVRIMSMLNRAMDALGHPERRQAHDQWIAEVEASARLPFNARPTQIGTQTPWPTTEINGRARSGRTPQPSRAQSVPVMTGSRSERSEHYAKVAVAMLIAAALSGVFVANLG